MFEPVIVKCITYWTSWHYCFVFGSSDSYTEVSYVIFQFFIV